jgi:hypothetical protein
MFGATQLQMDVPLQCCLPLPATGAQAAGRLVGVAERAGRREHYLGSSPISSAAVLAPALWWSSTDCSKKGTLGTRALIEGLHTHISDAPDS